MERSRDGRGSRRKRDAPTKGTKMLPTEKLIGKVVELNNKERREWFETSERRAAFGRVRVTTNPDRSFRAENFSSRKGSGQDRILPNGTAVRREKFCKTFRDTPETRNMTNCCCVSSQLDEDHGCSADCRCPETLFTIRRQHFETPADCAAAYRPEAHREYLAGTRHYDCRDEKRADVGTRLSRIGYVEERGGDDDCHCGDATLGDGPFHGISDDRQPSENSRFVPSLEDGATICRCPEEAPRFKVPLAHISSSNRWSFTTTEFE